MKIQIKSILGSVLFEADCGSVCEALVEAVKKRADLQGADLQGADLQGAYLRGAYLQGADLQGADLQGAYLQGAYLRGADLQGADLQGADLQGAYLRGAKLTTLQTSQLSILPAGDLIGWKKCQDGVLVKLRINAATARSNATGRKCRAEEVDVLEVIGAEFGISQHDRKTEYRAGQTVKCDKWCEDQWNECAGGIHFFITKEEAEAY